MKILYLMHINWHWIRQRPQVMAELLAQDHDVRVMHYAMYRSAHRVQGGHTPPGARVLHRLPGRIKRALPGAGRLDRAWIAHQVGAEARRFEPDLVWVTHPDFEGAVRASKAKRVVYDCMDDYLAFDEQVPAGLAAAEQRLLQAAELTLFSSDTLAERVSSRARPSHQLVVHNGVDESLCERAVLPAAAAAAVPGGLHLGYFGTLSHWFDWPLVLQWLQAVPQLELRLAGPVESALPQHPRIHHVGVLAHGQLAAFAQDCHALVMPFKLTPLIQAVDPVKLYEYIAFGRPALAPRYRESERFEPFVSLYRDAAESVATLQTWVGTHLPAPPPRVASQTFLHAQTWQCRGAQIKAALG